MQLWIVVAVATAGTNLDAEYACRHEREQWQTSGVQPPCDVLTANDTAAALEQAWGLTPTQAQCAYEAARTPRPKRRERDLRVPAWRLCLGIWPTSRIFWRGYVSALEGREPDAELLDALPSKATDGGRSLIEELLTVPYAARGGLLARLVRQKPETLIETLRTGALDDADRFVLAADALEQRPLVGREWDEVLPALIRYPLEEKQPIFAAEQWMRAPEALRRTTATALPLESRLSTQLALGLIALGQKDEAARLSFRSDLHENDREEKVFEDALQWHLTGKRSRSPWDAAISLAHLGGWELWQPLLPYVHPHEAFFASRFATVERGERTRPDTPDVSDPMAARLDASKRRAIEAVKKVVPFSAEESVDAGVVSLPDVGPPPFVERNAPWKGKSGQPLALAKGALRGFYVVRTERTGGRVAVLALSQRLDPVGEVSLGGYWLLLSPNGVDSWTEVYLGLSDFRPFHAQKKSDVPLIDDKNVVRLDMQESPLDETTITFPPIATTTNTKREHVILEAPLASLVRDSDRDGLSDLVELRMLLDPRKADTDGDGIADGDDLTPRLDDRLPQTALSNMLNTFLETFTQMDAPEALIVAPGSNQAKPSRPKRDLETVIFLQGNASSLAGLKPLFRIITLSERELAAAQERFGEFYPMEIRIALDGSDRAYVEWNEGWRGGACRIDRDAHGELVISEVEIWIS